MGEARRRKSTPASVLYHHTSTLRTNQLWMAECILPEGRMAPVLHPDLGEVRTDARFRRRMVDFPAVVWLTNQSTIPNCLRTIELAFVDSSGKRLDLPKDFPKADAEIADQIALNRFAIGFPIDALDVTRWPEHPGYGSSEGRELNETARSAGDDPRDWYVAAEPIDLMLATEVWFSQSRSNQKLIRQDWYLPDMKRMVQACRTTPGTYIPPSWLTPEQAKALGARLGVPVQTK